MPAHRLTICSLILLAALSGCKSVPLAPVPDVASVAVQPDPAPPAAPANVLPSPKPKVKTGMVFGKALFEGVVKASYIKLSIEDAKDPQKVVHLYIGDKSRQKSFLWNVESVRPGYFFIELPEGDYRISALTIPVGSTFATERMNVSFHVKPQKIFYLGTLNVVGTKERIRLGGLPVIRPGFEYDLTILNEREEALEEFAHRYPHIARNLDVMLMKDSGPPVSVHPSPTVSP